MDPNASVGVVERFYREAFDGPNIEVADELLTADFVDHEAPPGVPPGPEGFKAFIRMVKAAFPDSAHEFKDIFAAGDRVAWRIEWRGTHTGAPFLGIPASGRPMVEKQVHIVRMAGGQIAEHWACRDDLGMFQQLGVIPPIGPGGGQQGSAASH